MKTYEEIIVCKEMRQYFDFLKAQTSYLLSFDFIISSLI